MTDGATGGARRVAGAGWWARTVAGPRWWGQPMGAIALAVSAVLLAGCTSPVAGVPSAATVVGAPGGGATPSGGAPSGGGAPSVPAVPPVNPAATTTVGQGVTPGVVGPASTAVGTAPTGVGGVGPTNGNGGNGTGGNGTGGNGNGGAGQSCDLDQVGAIAGESAADDNQRTPGWPALRANGWTVFVPSGDWHLTSSDAGFSAISPTGGIEADDVSWPSQTPWTESALEQKFLADVANYQMICQTSYAQSASGGSQGFEFTAVEDGAPIQGVLILTLPTPQTTGFYSGQIRDLFTPQGQFTTDNADTLMLIIKRAIFQP